MRSLAVTISKAANSLAFALPSIRSRRLLWRKRNRTSILISHAGAWAIRLLDSQPIRRLWPRCTTAS
jgi:hypothetical protein